MGDDEPIRHPVRMLLPVAKAYIASCMDTVPQLVLRAVAATGSTGWWSAATSPPLRSRASRLSGKVVDCLTR